MLQRVVKEVCEKFSKDVDSTVYLKAVAEMQMWGGAFEEAKHQLEKAHQLLQQALEEQKMPHPPTLNLTQNEKTSAFEILRDELNSCEQMLSICKEKLVSPAQRQLEQDDFEVRELDVKDAKAIERFYREVGARSTLWYSSDLPEFLEANRGLCWAAEEGCDSLVAIALAITDGTFGYMEVIHTAGTEGVAAAAVVREKAVFILKEQGVHEVNFFSKEAPKNTDQTQLHNVLLL
eukprot:TRINITY_DN93797_c0_g1_i1.p1 TRINITY_DN93797_c0_g1~~TRINITY_DN93797_c0_g1_i1.p1  ORF type:complete len:234 (-),score=61.24 TRINITY_DN93797_c0_g1_i1:115-816(-)